MCADRGATPLQEELEQGACKNPHGFGFAMIVGDKIISERTMDSKRSISRFLKLRQEHPEGYALWHARIATHGSKNEANCHPFRVGGDNRTYLGHNGVLPINVDPKDHRSDTRIFAEELLPSIGGVTALDKPLVWVMMRSWITYNKIAVLTVDPEAENQLYLLNEKGGQWDDNKVWWSNQTHIKPVIYTPPSDYGYRNWGKGNWESSGSYQNKGFNYYGAHKYDFETKEFELQEGWFQKANGDWARISDATPAELENQRPKQLALVPALEPELAPEDDEQVLCPNCEQTVSLKYDADYCEICGCCFGCMAQFQDCMCHNTSNWAGHTGY